MLTDTKLYWFVISDTTSILILNITYTKLYWVILILSNIRLGDTK